MVLDPQKNIPVKCIEALSFKENIVEISANFNLSMDK